MTKHMERNLSWYNLQVSRAGSSPDWCGSVGWVSSCKVKGCWFDSWSGHMPGLWVQTPVGVCTGGNWSMFVSHIDLSLLLSLPPFPSLQKYINKIFFKKEQDANVCCWSQWDREVVTAAKLIHDNRVDTSWCILLGGSVTRAGKEFTKRRKCGENLYSLSKKGEGLGVERYTALWGGGFEFLLNHNRIKNVWGGGCHEAPGLLGAL